MSAVPTVKLFRGAEHLICNVDDQERFLAAGWAPAPPTPEPVEPPAPPTPEPPRRSRK